MIAFVMTAEVAEKFFKRCLEREAVTEEERLAILAELTQEDNCAAIEGSDTKEGFINKLTRYFRVWSVSKKAKKVA